MNFLRTSLEQIRQALADMSVQSRLAAGLLVVLVVFSLAWIVTGASRSDLVSLNVTPMSAEELAESQRLLDDRNVDVRVEDGYLQVPVDQKLKAQAVLAQNSIAQPADMPDYAETALSSSIWRTESEARRQLEHATQQRLSALISEFTDVARAQVIIQQGQAKGLGSKYIPGSVSVHLTMEHGAATTPRMRRAIADTVIPAVKGLKRSDVRIVDATNNQSFVMKDEGTGGDERLETVDSWESHYRNNIQAALSYIPGVLVSVSVETDPTREVRTEDRRYFDPVTAKVESTSDTVEGVGGAAVEPGVRANTNASVSIPTATVGRGGSRESSETVNEVRFPETVTTRIEGPAGARKKSASVGVPYSYLVESFRALQGEDDAEAKPADADIDLHLARIRDQVVNTLGAEDPSQVTVTWFVDAMAAGAGEPVQAGVSAVLNANGKSIALGTLAVLSLLMVMMFARRRVPDPPIMDQPVNPDDDMETALDALGAGEGALEGIELDEDSIRSQKIVDQVRDMVMERPDSAANLVRRWIEQS